MYLDILHCGLARWTDKWGDPLLQGVAIMGLFALAAALATLAALRTKGRDRLFWVSVACACALFAANVHLDLHVLPNAIGRCAAAAQGWFDQKEIARAAFIGGALAATGGLALVVLWQFWRQLKENLLVLLGVGLTVGAQAAKGLGWKGDELAFGPVSAPDAPDVIGAAMVIVGALIALRRLRAG